MKVFLDLGTNEFQGLLLFTKKLNLGKDTIIYTYEANPTVYNKTQEILKKIENKYKKIYHINKAVLDYDGNIILNNHYGAWVNNVYIENYTGGSNIIDINPQYDPLNGAKFNIKQEDIECIDINNIIENIIETNGENVEIYIKCDIEGSEFKVLPKLLSSYYIKNIKEIHIEWHERFYLNTEDYKNICDLKKNIIDSLNEKNIQYYEHF